MSNTQLGASSEPTELGASADTVVQLPAGEPPIIVLGADDVPPAPTELGAEL